MKMRTQIFVRLQGLAEGFGHSARLERAEANARFRCGGAQGRRQLKQRGWLRKIQAIRAYLDAGDDNFAVTILLQSGALAHSVGKRHGA